MSNYKELSVDQKIETIEGIQFTVMSPEDIERRSVAEIVSTDTFTGNEPVIGGLFDPRMGVIEHNKICKTCELKNTFCPGHFGHIRLARPVFYIQFFDTIRKLLRCVCYKCSSLLISGDDLQEKKLVHKKTPRQKRFDIVYKLCTKVKIKKCGECGAAQPDKMVKENVGRIIMEWKSEDGSEEPQPPVNPQPTGMDNVFRHIYYAEDVLAIVRRLKDKDLDVMGFAKELNMPQWMVCTVFPVPPPAVRPSVRNDTGQRSEDDLTHKLCDIVKTNNTLKQKIEKNSSKEQIEYWSMLLQYHISTFVDNQIPGVAPAKQRTGRTLRSLRERLKGKEGRIRGNLMGKRVDFSARSVITPDPNISIDELGVPEKVAMNLTVPEIVNRFNIDELQKFVINGPHVFPGAKCIRRAKDKFRTVILKHVDRSTIVLEEGDVVDRHMKNGDYVLFNRQPSLHKMSMMGHRIRVMPYDTFRLNVCVTPCYNADYDGDEMNAHLPQSIQTENELIQLASVPTQIISPRDSSPIISVVQDIALGVYRLTKSSVVLTEKQMFNLLTNNSKFVGNVPRPLKSNEAGNFWSGRQLLSTILPPNIQMRAANKNYDPTKNNGDQENFVVIENGEIKQGTVDKTTYQSATHGLIHTVYNENGPDETRRLFDNTQRMICNWLVYSGFSVGVSDLVVDKETTGEMTKVIHDMKVKAYEMISSIHMRTYENKSIYSNAEDFENKVNNILNEATNKMGKIGLSKIQDDNRMINMIKSGSKGSQLNVAQMVAALGQQNVDGKRISYGFDDRTLPHYTRFDDGPESRGFVENSFIKGLTPQEFFFHAMGGREGLIDTAVKTSETGYIQRKLVKAMEDCKIQHDLTVRNATGSIIQYLYGEDGMSSTKLENQIIPYIEMKGDEPMLVLLEREYLLSAQDELKYILTDDTAKSFLKDRNASYERLQKHYMDILNDREFMITRVFQSKMEKKVKYPISFARVLSNAENLFHTKELRMPSDLSPLDILDTIEALEKELILTNNNPGNRLLQVLMRAYLSPKPLLYKHRFNKLAFEYVVQQIKHKFYQALAHPSEMVGVISAQSIGEPTTQLTLNTFHQAGSSAASKTVRGVPRIKELLSVSKNIKTPSMTIFLHPDIKKHLSPSNDVKNMIETSYVGDFVKSSRILFDPSDTHTDLGEDRLFMEMYDRFEALRPDKEQGPVSPFLLRLEIDKAKMADAGITMHDIHFTLYNFYEDSIQCMFSDDNADKLVFRIRLSDTSVEDAKTDLSALEQTILENVIVKGIKGVRKVMMTKKDGYTYNPLVKSFESTYEWQLSTDGTNLLDVFSLPQVDFARTVSNDINEVYGLLGVEAARQCMINEIVECLEGVSMNFRHISLLADVMTYKGALLSIDRHGINRSDIGPLAKCSFEETSDMLIKAGMFAEYDPITGVSANIMLGQIPPCGTGDTMIMIDEEKLLEMEPPLSAATDKDQMDDEKVEESCAPESFGFSFRMPVAKKAGTAAQKETIALHVV